MTCFSLGFTAHTLATRLRNLTNTGDSSHNLVGCLSDESKKREKFPMEALRACFDSRCCFEPRLRSRRWIKDGCHSVSGCRPQEGVRAPERGQLARPGEQSGSSGAFSMWVGGLVGCARVDGFLAFPNTKKPWRKTSNQYPAVCLRCR